MRTPREEGLDHGAYGWAKSYWHHWTLEDIQAYDQGYEEQRQAARVAVAPSPSGGECTPEELAYSPEKLRRKIGQAWELAGCARQDGDKADEVRRTNEALRLTARLRELRS